MNTRQQNHNVTYYFSRVIDRETCEYTYYTQAGSNELVEFAVALFGKTTMALDKSDANNSMVAMLTESEYYKMTHLLNTLGFSVLNEKANATRFQSKFGMGGK